MTKDNPSYPELETIPIRPAPEDWLPLEIHEQDESPYEEKNTNVAQERAQRVSTPLCSSYNAAYVDYNDSRFSRWKNSQGPTLTAETNGIKRKDSVSCQHFLTMAPKKWSIRNVFSMLKESVSKKKNGTNNIDCECKNENGDFDFIEVKESPVYRLICPSVKKLPLCKRFTRFLRCASCRITKIVCGGCLTTSNINSYNNEVEYINVKYRDFVCKGELYTVIDLIE